MPPNPAKIIDMASAFYESNVLFAASDLGVFGLLAELGTADLATVAERLGLDSRGVRLLLDACVSLELLEQDGEKYRCTADAAMFLVPGAPGDLSAAIRYNRDVYAAWGELPRLVRSGKPVEKPEIHLGEDPERTRSFVMAMHGRAMGIGRMVVPMLKLSGKFLDVGGGSGAYSILAVKGNPEASGVMMDLPGVAAIAREIVAAEGLADKIRVVDGNYRQDAFPDGNDAVLFLGVLHQESPEMIGGLMRRAMAALKPGGTVHVMDMMTDATRTRPKFSALFAVNMALTTKDGWVFSERDLRGWMENAGLVDFSVAPLPPPMPHWLASARKPA